MEQIIHANWLWLIPALPLAGALINGAFGLKIHRKFGETPIHALAIAMPAASFLLTTWHFFVLLRLPVESRQLLCHLFSWIEAGSFSVPMAFLFDPLSAAMTLMITFVGTLIHIYSIGYMHKDPGYWRFFAYLNLFMFAMLMLILGDNFLLMFIGWEGVGLCSYLLISFWYQDLKNARAGMKAFITNRVGDFGFIIGLFTLLWALGGTWDSGKYALAHPENISLVFREIQSVAHHLNGQVIFGVAIPTFICCLFLWGATAKSAQIPLYIWLPDAMAGPTPVSALIHAATMVTAGVYMVARLNFLFVLSPVAMTAVATIGAATALFAATIGLFQYDIKKVLAYSTVSQLGYMFLAVGVGAYSAGIFHLLTHAFFKACLFLGSGSVIHAMHHALHHIHDSEKDPQDMRNMGGLGRYMKTTRWTYLAACCAIAGFPLFSGFFSKDEILYRAFANANTLVPGKVLWFVGACGAVLTAFYMFRSYFMTFTGRFRGGESAEHHLNESPKTITTTLTILGVLSIIGGAIGLPVLWHLPNFLEIWLEPVFEHSKEYVKWNDYPHSVEWILMMASVMIAFTGFGAAALLYRNAKSSVPAKLLEKFSTIHKIVFNKYYIDEFYQATVIRATVVASTICGWFDKYIIDGIVNLIGLLTRLFAFLNGLHDTYIIDGAVNGIGAIALYCGRVFRVMQTGKIQTYLYGMIGGGLALIAIRFFLMN